MEDLSSWDYLNFKELQMANEIHDHANLTPEPGISKRLLLKQAGLHVLGISALTSGVVSLVGNGQANAQEPTQFSERTAHLLELMRKGDDAFNAHDFDAMKAVHHPDMIAYVTGNPQPLYGRDAHAAAMGQFFSIFPDVHVDNDPYPIQFGSGDWVTVVSRTTGTFAGAMTLPDGTTIAPTGAKFDVAFGQTSRWDGDVIVEISAFWDSHLQAQQLGLA
ncbi:MAG: DUF4440 domain-containing protein [Mesorhizobium sp.]|jgi:hypothetical protein|nr:MAG: DUF4440 domain-containing protein [Mesorhizobium sp.]